MFFTVMLQELQCILDSPFYKSNVRYYSVTALLMIKNFKIMKRNFLIMMLLLCSGYSDMTIKYTLCYIDITKVRVHL